jgi:hypothetical protein
VKRVLLASTMYSAVRQLGGAVGVARLATVIVRGAATVSAGPNAANPAAYRVAFLVAAAMALAALFCSLAIHDADAAVTIPAHTASEHRHSERELAPAVA